MPSVMGKERRKEVAKEDLCLQGSTNLKASGITFITGKGEKKGNP